MSEPEIDIAALVEAVHAVVADTFFYPNGFINDQIVYDETNLDEIARAILTAVLPLVLAGPREALGPFAAIQRTSSTGPVPPIAVINDAALTLARSTLTRIEALLKDESRGTG